MMMIVFALIAVGVSTYVWMTRGFFSALLHMLCVLVAGAIAFGVWEPLGYLFLDIAPDRGFSAFLGDMAWGLALALPFALSLAVLRVAVDSLLPANVVCDKTTNYVGGAACGLVSGVVSGGIIVLSIGFLRLPSDFGGYKAVISEGTANRGSIEKAKGMMKPWVDEITAGLYSHLSTTTLRTGDPLATWHPDFALLPASMRMSYEDADRTTAKPASFSIAGAYTVGDVARGAPIDSLLHDSWSTAPQRVTDLHGEKYPDGYLAEYTIKFMPSAREQTGNVVVGNGQVRLVASDGEGQSVALHPIAIITNQDDPTKIAYERFRMDTDKAFFSSVGATSEPLMGFEFAVPTGYKPLALYVKGTRADVEPVTPVAFEDTKQRDEAIVAGKLAGLGGVGPVIDPNTGEQVKSTEAETPLDREPFQISSALGFNIQKSKEAGLQVQQEARGWSIVDGEATLRRSDVGKAVDFKLQISKFNATPDVAVVQVNFTPLQRKSEFGQALDSAERLAAPRLVDMNGNSYEAVGYLYQDATNYKIRYTKGQPLRAMTEVPSVGRNDPSRSLKLIFLVSSGVEIRSLQLGSKVIEQYDPPKKVEGGR
jgi:hypothetical protein